MSKNDFVKKPNIMMLWELISENDLVKDKSMDEINNIRDFLNKILPEFYEAERKIQPDLMSMNKKFLEYVFSIISKSQRQNRNNNQSQERNKQLITNEEIKESRINQFENDLAERQQDFTNSMTLPVPEAPKFSDNLDTPIYEMETIVKRTIAQRNMEMNQVYNSMVNQSQVENWLKSSETSIKKEKMNNNINNASNNSNNNNNNNKVRYIKIENENIDNNILKNDIIDLNEREKQYQQEQLKKMSNKQISFNNKIEIKEIPNNDDNISLFIEDLEPKNNNENKDYSNIFSKLKRVPETEKTNKINSDLSKPITNNFIDEEMPKNINDRFDVIQEQIKKLSNTLESHMDKCNNTLTILYSLLMKQDKEREELKLSESKNKEIIHPENPNSDMLM